MSKTFVTRGSSQFSCFFFLAFLFANLLALRMWRPDKLLPSNLDSLRTLNIFTPQWNLLGRCNFQACGRILKYDYSNKTLAVLSHDTTL